MESHFLFSFILALGILDYDFCFSFIGPRSSFNRCVQRESRSDSKPGDLVTGRMALWSVGRTVHIERRLQFVGERRRLERRRLPPGARSWPACRAYNASARSSTLCRERRPARLRSIKSLRRNQRIQSCDPQTTPPYGSTYHSLYLWHELVTLPITLPMRVSRSNENWWASSSAERSAYQGKLARKSRMLKLYSRRFRLACASARALRAQLTSSKRVA